MRAVCTVDIEISNHHYTLQEHCALSKLKFLVIILPHESSVQCKIEILVVILAYLSSVHCKIEISTHHFTP